MLFNVFSAFHRERLTYSWCYTFTAITSISISWHHLAAGNEPGLQRKCSH